MNPAKRCAALGNQVKLMRPQNVLALSREGVGIIAAPFLVSTVLSIIIN